MVLLLRKRHLLTVVAAAALCGALLLTARPGRRPFRAALRHSGRSSWMPATAARTAGRCRTAAWPKAA